jgi:hypothetical protein
MTIKAIMDKKRIVVFFIFVGLFSASYQIGSISQVSDEESGQFLDQFKSLVQGIDGFEIFIHNTTISMPMFIPGFGIAWGFFAGWSTGFGFAAIIKSAPALSHIPALAILYVSPFGIMELVAYSLAISRSYLLIFAIIKKTSIRPQISPLVMEIGIVLVLLLAGGLLEFAMIQNVSPTVLSKVGS